MKFIRTQFPRFPLTFSHSFSPSKHHASRHVSGYSPPLPPFFAPKLPSVSATKKAFLPWCSKFQPISFSSLIKPLPKTHFIVRADDGYADVGGPDDYDMDGEEVELSNKKDYDVEYDPLAAAAAAVDEDITMVDSKNFVYTQRWDSEMEVDYRIDEEEFHKISLMECDFVIRKPAAPDNDVYDFREMYVTPPDTDI